MNVQGHVFIKSVVCTYTGSIAAVCDILFLKKTFVTNDE